MVGRLAMWRAVFEDWPIEELVESYEPTDPRVLPMYVSPGWIPITDENGNCYALDLSPTASGSIGQIIKFGADEASPSFVAPNLATWLRQLAS